MLDLLGGDSGSLIFADLPDGLHHADEVLVAGQAHRQIGVVVVPLLSTDRAVVVAAHAVEPVQEFLQDLIAGLLSVDEVLVLRNVVDCVDISDGDSVGAVTIDEGEGLVNHGLSALGERVSEAADELLVSDVAVAIHIVVLHQSLNLNHLREKPVGGESLSELAQVELLVAVVVHAAEDDAEGADTDATSLLDLHLELVVDATDLDVEAHAVQLRHT
mmetsp:Transcript_20665/g.27882  ORF Transcript_20665/g.27882 Transcript_20665/m.27882 type:complete len:217 (-) Transcript_20665:25-675(-)